MKKITIKTYFVVSMIFVMVVSMLFSSLGGVSADSGGVGYTFEETFPDSALATFIAERCDKDVTDTIEENDISSFTSMFAISIGVSDLTGMNYLTNLRSFNLSSNQITDLSPLANLSRLESVTLDNNQIYDIKPLSNLPNLTYLDLRSNQIRDITPLSSINNLATINFYNNQITDISPLSNLFNLRSVNLNSNQIRDVSPLANLTNLSTLNLFGNQISDISPLVNLTNLNHLVLHEQAITIEAIPYENPLVVDNVITTIDGSLITNVYGISDRGVYDNGQIIWSDLDESISSTRYSFRDESGQFGNATYYFYGVVTQLIAPAKHELAVSVILEGTKYLSNKDLEDNMFTFVMEDENGNNIATTTNNMDGNIDFGEIVYTEVGEYVYKIKEVDDEQENIIYDTTEYIATVIVTEEEDSLVADVKLSEDEIVFINIYNDTKPVTPEKPIIEEPNSNEIVDTMKKMENNNLDTTPTNIVQTGDYSNPILFILNGVVISSIVIIKRKKVYK